MHGQCETVAVPRRPFRRLHSQVIVCYSIETYVVAHALVLRRGPWKLKKFFLEHHAQSAFYLEGKNQAGINPRGGWGHIFGTGAEVISSERGQISKCAFVRLIRNTLKFEVFYQTIKIKNEICVITYVSIE